MTQESFPDPIIEAFESPLPFGDELLLKTPFPIPRHHNLLPPLFGSTMRSRRYRAGIVPDSPEVFQRGLHFQGTSPSSSTERCSGNFWYRARCTAGSNFHMREARRRLALSAK